MNQRFPCSLFRFKSSFFSSVSRTFSKTDETDDLIVHYVVLACNKGGRWGPDVFTVVRDLVRMKAAPLHPLLRRSAELAYTRRWWSILAMQAQSAAIDCILGQDPQVVVPHDAPPLASVLAWADIEKKLNG